MPSAESIYNKLPDISSIQQTVDIGGPIVKRNRAGAFHPWAFVRGYAVITEMICINHPKVERLAGIRETRHWMGLISMKLQEVAKAKLHVRSKPDQQNGMKAVLDVFIKNSCHNEPGLSRFINQHVRRPTSCHTDWKVRRAAYGHERNSPNPNVSQMCDHPLKRRLTQQLRSRNWSLREPFKRFGFGSCTNTICDTFTQ
jgi:hypothetical protein